MVLYSPPAPAALPLVGKPSVDTRPKQLHLVLVAYFSHIFQLFSGIFSRQLSKIDTTSFAFGDLDSLVWWKGDEDGVQGDPDEEGGEEEHKTGRNISGDWKLRSKFHFV